MNGFVCFARITSESEASDEMPPNTRLLTVPDAAQSALRSLYLISKPAVRQQTVVGDHDKEGIFRRDGLGYWMPMGECGCCV